MSGGRCAGVRNLASRGRFRGRGSGGRFGGRGVGIGSRGSRGGRFGGSGVEIGSRGSGGSRFGGRSVGVGSRGSRGSRFGSRWSSEHFGGGLRGRGRRGAGLHSGGGGGIGSRGPFGSGRGGRRARGLLGGEQGAQQRLHLGGRRYAQVAAAEILRDRAQQAALQVAVAGHCGDGLGQLLGKHVQGLGRRLGTLSLAQELPQIGAREAVKLRVQQQRVGLGCHGKDLAQRSRERAAAANQMQQNC
jgi:hypothetical protein